MNVFNPFEPLNTVALDDLAEQITYCPSFSDEQKQLMKMSLQLMKLTLEGYQIDQEQAMQDAIDELINPSPSNPLLTSLKETHSLN